MLICYLAVINILAFILYGIDKSNAVHHSRRVPERTLLLLALVGGSIGALIAMYMFHHKTRKKRFSFGVPVMLLLQIAAYIIWMQMGQ